MTTTREPASTPGAPDDLERRLAPLIACPLPFHLNREWQPCAVLEQGSAPHRLIVLSLPKAGTYYLAELLRAWGSAPTHLHVSLGSTWDYRQRTLDEIRADSFRYEVAVPLEQSLALVREGQFAVGHIEHTPAVADLLRPFRKIFIYRDLRDALISQMRFLVNNPSTAGRIGAWKDLPDGAARMAGFLADPKETDYMFGLFHRMRPWIDQDDVFALSFEELHGDVSDGARQARLGALHAFAGAAPSDEAPAATADRLRGCKAITWSGERSARPRHWSDEAERLFVSLGGHELNASYGYHASRE
ncbi:MAG: hypothetical protein IT184_13135 [Acidobacteria bacterium]|nr:hypothetical protein [Acidobacteriota bacterium]